MDPVDQIFFDWLSRQIAEGRISRGAATDIARAYGTREFDRDGFYMSILDLPPLPPEVQRKLNQEERSGAERNRRRRMEPREPLRPLNERGDPVRRLEELEGRPKREERGPIRPRGLIRRNMGFAQNLEDQLSQRQALASALRAAEVSRRAEEEKTRNLSLLRDLMIQAQGV